MTDQTAPLIVSDYEITDDGIRTVYSFPLIDADLSASKSSLMYFRSFSIKKMIEMDVFLKMILSLMDLD